MGCNRESAPVSANFHYKSHITYRLIRFRCLEHVVNLANVAVMSHITKIAIVENSNAIWEYDPELPGNRVLGGSLDVVAAIRTLAVKVCTNIYFVNSRSNFMCLSQIQASGQRIEYFEKLQLQFKIATPLKIPLHNNTRWGTAHKMLERSYKLQQVRNRFHRYIVTTYFDTCAGY